MLHPAPDRRHALTDVEVEPLDKGRVDGPATGRQDLLDGQPGAEHHAVCDAHEAPAPVRLHHLRVAQLGQRHPARLGHWAFVLAPFGLHPLAKMRQECRAVVLEAIGQKQRDTAWRQHLGDLMHDALRHRQGAAADIDHHQQLALGSIAVHTQ